MGLVSTINKIPSYIGLEKATSAIGAWLNKHPTVYKIVLIVMHIFRALAMIALMYFLPFGPLVNMAIGIGASLLYRITVERFCPYTFAVQACAGAAAFELSRPFLVDIISGVAFESLNSIAATLFGIIPLVVTSAIIIAVSNDTVDQRYAEFKKKQEENKSSTDDCGSCCTVQPKNNKVQNKPVVAPQPLVATPTCCECTGA